MVVIKNRLIGLLSFAYAFPVNRWQNQGCYETIKCRSNCVVFRWKSRRGSFCNCRDNKISLDFGDKFGQKRNSRIAPCYCHSYLNVIVYQRFIAVD